MNEQEFTPEPAGLVPLVLIAVEVDEPVEHVVDRFSDEIVLDDVGMRAIPAAAARQFLTERAEQTARMEEQSRRIQEEMALMPRPRPRRHPRSGRPERPRVVDCRRFLLRVPRGGVRSVSAAELPCRGARGRTAETACGARRDQGAEEGEVTPHTSLAVRAW